jgi:hypothetical protein
MTARAASEGRRSVFARSVLRRLGPRWLALLPLTLSGCYTYAPLRTAAAPAPGEQIQVELSDAGRVGMASDLGPEMAKVEGTLVSASDSLVVMRVSQVWGEYGGVSRWQGEQVAFKGRYIRTLRERRFSTTRTAILAATVGAGVVVFVVTRNLLGIGVAPGTASGGGASGQQ